MARPTARSKKRIAIMFIILIALFVVMAIRTAWIQIVDADGLTEKAINQQTSDLLIEPQRGDILDANGNQLATSVTCYSVWIRPSQIKANYSDAEIKELSQKLANIIGSTTEKIQKYMTSDQALIQIAKYLTKAKNDQIKELKIVGLESAQNTKRYYPMETTASNLLGSVNDDNEGRSGIELQYNSNLSGVSGRWIKDTDINGQTLSYGNKKYYAAQDGYNVNLTVDVILQKYAEDAIEDGLKTTGAKRIMIVAMRPKTGEVLAMATTDNFDPNEPLEPVSSSEKKKFDKMSNAQKTQYLSKMWSNPLVSDLYEPGSTFKLLTTSACLEEGVVTPNSTFVDNGSINVDGVRLRCWGHAHGKQTVTEAVGNSCNPVLVQMGLKLGKSKFYDYLEMFGITQSTGIDLPAEASAIIQNEDSLTRVDLATMSYGHGIALTPIQILTAVNAIGNDGVLLKPRTVKSLTDNDGKVIQEFGKEEVRQVISEETAEEMKKIMEYDVTDGGVKSAAISGYRIGGKTGTAYKSANGGYSNQVYASFIGMAPIDDPEISVLVIVDSPKKGFYGSEVGAPIGKAFLSNALQYLEIEPKYSSSEKGDTKSVAVPNVTGKSADKAIEILKEKGLKYTIVPSGSKTDFKVLDQYPKAGKTVNSGSSVYLYKE